MSERIKIALPEKSFEERLKDYKKYIELLTQEDIDRISKLFSENNDNE